MRILLIEDDPMIGKALVRGLSDRGMSVDWVHNGAEGSTALAHAEHALVLLDIGLPEMSGIDVLKAARTAGVRVPVLVITARDSLDDRIAGLDLGADDYIVKPFELRELVARMRAVLRRHNGQAQSLITSGEIMLDLATHQTRYRSTEHILPAREFALLQALMQRPGAILSRAQIEQQIYGWGEEVESNAVDVLIHAIRKKFDKDIIRNVRGAGWMVVKSET
jgi:two-component system, OmpR family, response regulator